MSEINLASRETNINDKNYRYKINALNVKCMGKQDNYTTYIMNSEEIATILKIPSEYYGKYIGYSLSCPMKMDKENKCLSFKGDYKKDIITKYFMEFVKTYILCPTCDFPETYLCKNAEKKLSQKCNSCGGIYIIKPKSNDKLYDYIDKKIK